MQFLRLPLSAVLLAASGPLLLGADGIISIFGEGSVSPLHYERDTDFAPVSGTPIAPQATSDDTRDQAYRLGLTLLIRIPTTTPFRPTVGASMGYQYIFNSMGNAAPPPVAGTPPPPVTAPEPTSRYRGTMRTYDIFGGVSFFASSNVIFDLLIYSGVGEGSATSNESRADYSNQTFDPSLKMKEWGLRLAVNFVSDRGMTLAVFGGIQSSRITEDGLQIDTPASGGAPSTAARSDYTLYKGGTAGLGLGYTF